MKRHARIISLLLIALFFVSCSPKQPVYQIVELNQAPITLSEAHALELQRIIEAVQQQPASAETVASRQLASAQAAMTFTDGEATFVFDSVFSLLIVDDTKNEGSQYYECKPLQFERVVEIYNLYSFFYKPKTLPDSYGQAWTMDEFKFYDANGNVVENANQWHILDENGDGIRYWLTNYPDGTTTFRGTKIGDSAAKVLTDYEDIGFNAMYGSDTYGWEPMKTSTKLIEIVEDAGENLIFVMIYYDQNLEPFPYYNYMFNSGEGQQEVEGYWSFAMKFESKVLVHLGFFYHEFI